LFAHGDGHLYYLMARSTVFDGDWSFENDLARFGDPFGANTTPTGRKGIVHPIGPPLVWAPILAAAQGMAWLLDQVGAEIPLHGYTAFHQRIVFATSVVFAWLATLLGLSAARRWVGGRWGPAVAGITVLLGTSLAYYAAYMPSYPHAMDAAFCAVFLHYWATSVRRRDARRFVLLGGWLGAAALIRSQNLALGVVVAVEIVAEIGALFVRPEGGAPTGIRRGATAARLVGLGALALAIALACFGIQLYEWHVVYGGWAGLPQGPRFTRLTHPLVLETLFSSRNGWFAITPVAYLGALGLLLLPRRDRIVGIGLLSVVLVQAYLCSTIFDWWAGSSFSQRRLSSMAYPLIVGLAMLLVSASRVAARMGIPRWSRHATALTILGWFVCWNVAQMFSLRDWKPANDRSRASCCDSIPAPMRWVAAPIYRAIGNPFALPASAYFALRYDVAITDWDLAVGSYALVPSLDDLTDGTYIDKARGTWNLCRGDTMAPWIVSGFSENHVELKGTPGGRFCWTTAPRARALVPLLMPDAEQATMWIRPNAAGQHIVIRWNDEVVADRDLADGWTPVHFDLEESLIRVGTNTLSIETTLDLSGRGVAMGPLELRFLGVTNDESRR
jgi:hypothetical protein